MCIFIKLFTSSKATKFCKKGRHIRLNKLVWHNGILICFEVNSHEMKKIMILRAEEMKEPLSLQMDDSLIRLRITKTTRKLHYRKKECVLALYSILRISKLNIGYIYTTNVVRTILIIYKTQWHFLFNS